MPGASTTRAAGIPSCPRERWPKGADLAIGSVHKTITGLGRTSVLSVGTDRIDSERLQLCFELEKSTSASTVLLSSIDGARRQFVRDGHELLDRAIATARHLRARLAAEVPELPVVTEAKLLDRPGVAAVDPTHPLIETWPVGLTGFEADDWIRDERWIDIELADHRQIMPLVTFAHGTADATGSSTRCATLSTPRATPAKTRGSTCPRAPSFAPGR